jgi:hypothetical protein
MNSKRLRRLRQQAYEKQHGRCFYCSYPMWVDDAASFTRIHQLPERFARYMKCTAEHLLARQDRGDDTAANVVAACAWCNTMRHQGRPSKAPDPIRYRQDVARHVALGRWHPVAASAKARQIGQLRAQT